MNKQNIREINFLVTLISRFSCQKHIYEIIAYVRHAVWKQKLSFTLFCQKFRESNGFTNVSKELHSVET